MGRIPRPALPIDECVSELIRKRRIRAAANLTAIHPLGACPYAVARSAVIRAASQARIQQSYESELKPKVAAAVKHFKDEGRWLGDVMYGAEVKAHILVDGLDLLQLSFPRRKALLAALSRSRELLESTSGDIASLHKQLSKHRGNVWRLSFVTSLFAGWWVLTGKNPKSSPDHVRNSSAPPGAAFRRRLLRPTLIGEVRSRSHWLDANRASGGASEADKQGWGVRQSASEPGPAPLSSAPPYLVCSMRRRTPIGSTDLDPATSCPQEGTLSFRGRDLRRESPRSRRRRRT